ncbi:MAG: phage terminase small subunit P27 family [Bilophila wadsworthia]
MAGRKPLPTHLKMVRGTLQKCRMNPDEPTPAPEIPDAPPHLSPEAREEWERLALELYELGILSTIDRAALAAASLWTVGRGGRAAPQHRQHHEARRPQTAISSEPSGGYRQQVAELMHKYLTEFGIPRQPHPRQPEDGREKGFAAL